MKKTGLCLILAIWFLTFTCGAKGEGRVTQCIALAEEIVHTLADPLNDDYEKALVLHDWLTDHVDYQLGDLESFHGDSALLDGYGVCQSYTEAYSLLLSKAGIRNELVKTSLHGWNLAQLNGKWYHIDCTWDDSTSSHRYFALPDEAVMEVDSHRAVSFAHSYQDNYAYREGLLDSYIRDYTEAIQERLDLGKRQFSINDEGWIFWDTYQIYRNTVILAVRDHEFRVDGSLKKVSITKDGGCLSVDADQEPEAPNETYEMSPFYGGVVMFDSEVVHSVDIRYSLVDGGTEMYLAKVKVVRDDGVVFIDEEGYGYFSSRDYTLPNGTYTITAWASDGMTEQETVRNITFWYKYLYDVKLPAGLQIIEERAFENGQFQSVKCPMDLRKIGNRAFSGCDKMQWIFIPETVSEIADDAFEGCDPRLVIEGIPGSYANQYADQHHLTFESYY